METIVVEAVTNKYANKFSNGSVLAGGKWLQVAKNVDLELFKKDTEIAVETYSPRYPALRRHYTGL